MSCYKKQIKNCLENLNKSIDEIDTIMESECFTNASCELEEIKEQLLEVIDSISNIDFSADEIEDLI